MPGTTRLSRTLTALFIYGRPPLVFASMLCAVAVLWTREPQIYLAGVILLGIAMGFDLVDGWFAARYHPHPTLADLADRMMDRVVYSIIFPLIVAGMMWRLIFAAPGHTRPEMLHAILVLFLCISVLVRDNFAHFIRGYADQQVPEPEARDFRRLRTMAAAPVAALLYVHAFYLPGGPSLSIYSWVEKLATLPLRFYLSIEILLLIITFGSIAAHFRKYGSLCLDEVCHEDDQLRRLILSFFPNFLTFMNAMMGLLAIFFAYQDRMRAAYLLVLGAAIFDKLDGALARRLGLTEPAAGNDPRPGISLGSILDDIADGISFCLVPALIFYLVLSDSPLAEISGLPLGWIALIYCLFGIGRLIYFTLDPAPIPGFFKGMPTPAAALLVTAPILLYSQALANGSEMTRFWGLFSVGLLPATALLMNLYPVHYLHIGRFTDRHPWFGRLNLALLIISVFTPYFGYLALAYLLAYLLSPLFTHRLEPRS
ncbi:MAG: CDP-alcohol phosphatidyltransferase family protein [Desulfobacterales bacterium]|nr:CDP-alcohol phosphatidyltransferase family protein [Desulfobacterales bacterium]